MKFGNVILIGSILLIAVSCKKESNQNLKIVIKESKIEQDSSLHLNFSKPKGSVADFEQVFTENEILELEHKLVDYKNSYDKEVLIVTVNSIEPYQNILDFGNALLSEWKSGISNNDNGLLILFSKSLGELSIITGLETGKKLTDDICQKVINKIIIPEFKDGRFYNGINIGLTNLMTYWK
jgi:uncharacterized protein